jgi:hypothetical protein
MLSEGCQVAPPPVGKKNLHVDLDCRQYLVLQQCSAIFVCILSRPPASLQSRGRAVVGALRGRNNCSMCGRSREAGNSEPFVVPSAVVPLIYDASYERSSHLSLDPSNLRDVIEVILLVLSKLPNFLRLRSLPIISSWSVAWHGAERRVPWWRLSPLEPA